MNKVLLAALLLTSCVESNVKEPKVVVKSKSTEYVILDEVRPVEIVTIDSCQYLYGPWGNATVFTHKGDCNNPIHVAKLKTNE